MANSSRPSSRSNGGGSSAGRSVTYNRNPSSRNTQTSSTSLSSRFQQVQQLRQSAGRPNHVRKVTGVSPGIETGSRGVRKSNNNRNTSGKMDVDLPSKNSSIIKKNTTAGKAVRGKKRGGNGGRGGRSGRGGEPKVIPPTMDDLNEDLDNYMMTESETSKSIL